jgi:hypothetical protein
MDSQGLWTVQICGMRTGISKTYVWRWQERFMAEGVDGLLRGKTRPSRVPHLSADIAAGVVAAPPRITAAPSIAGTSAVAPGYEVLQ